MAYHISFSHPLQQFNGLGGYSMFPSPERKLTTNNLQGTNTEQHRTPPEMLSGWLLSLCKLNPHLVIHFLTTVLFSMCNNEQNIHLGDKDICAVRLQLN